MVIYPRDGFTDYEDDRFKLYPRRTETRNWDNIETFKSLRSQLTPAKIFLAREHKGVVHNASVMQFVALLSGFMVCKGFPIYLENKHEPQKWDIYINNTIHI